MRASIFQVLQMKHQVDPSKPSLAQLSEISILRVVKKKFWPLYETYISGSEISCRIQISRFRSCRMVRLKMHPKKLKKNAFFAICDHFFHTDFFRMTWNLIQYSTLMRTISTINFVQIGQRLVPQKWSKVPRKSYLWSLMSHSTALNRTTKAGLFCGVQWNMLEDL